MRCTTQPADPNFRLMTSALHCTQVGAMLALGPRLVTADINEGWLCVWDVGACRVEYGPVGCAKLHALHALHAPQSDATRPRDPAPRDLAPRDLAPRDLAPRDLAPDSQPNSQRNSHHDSPSDSHSDSHSNPPADGDSHGGLVTAFHLDDYLSAVNAIAFLEPTASALAGRLYAGHDASLSGPAQVTCWF